MNGPGEALSATPKWSGKLSTRSKGTLMIGAAAILALPRMAAAGQASFKTLEEPTPEFKAEQAAVAKFKEKQAKIKANWDRVLSRFEATEDPKELEMELKNLKGIIEDLHGIPVGVKKMPVVKLCRKKKFGNTVDKKGKKKMDYWTKDVEIAYEAFIQTYNRETNPDTTTRDTGSAD